MTGNTPQKKFEKCGNKPCYPKKVAFTVANQRHKDGVEHLRVYYCDVCNWWHLTRSKK